MNGEDYRDRRVLVVGLARSGVAAVEFLLRNGARVWATDLKSEGELPKEAADLRRRGVEMVLGSHPPGLVADCDLVVVSPGVPPETAPVMEARAKQIPVWGELELAFRQIGGLVIAVTGTKGKSTTATLIAEILRKAGREVQLGGNIGRPLIRQAEQSRADTHFVVEVSSFQLEATERFRPRLAVLLDVTPDHLDRHGSFETYVRTKERIFSNQEAGDWAVVYGGSQLTMDMANKSRSNKVYFSLDCMGPETPHVCVDGPWIVKHASGETTALVSMEKIPLRGRHNVENVMAAAAAAMILDVDLENVRQTVCGFHGLPHALEKVGEADGVVFYNDSKATNVAAVKAALASFEGGVLLILGGRSKGADFGELRSQVERKVKRVVAIGETSRRVDQMLGDLVPVDPVNDLGEAVETAFRQAVPGDTVLLSPACASFDMFADYEERGVRFREEVEKLIVSSDARGTRGSY